MAGAFCEQGVNGGANGGVSATEIPWHAACVLAFVQNQDYLWLVSASTI
jgi:hypothetical protein